MVTWTTFRFSVLEVGATTLKQSMITALVVIVDTHVIDVNRYGGYILGMGDVDAIRLVGGRLCLDFVNTANWDNRQVAEEHLLTLDHLSRWGRRVGLKLTPIAIPETTEGRALLEEVVTFRRRLRNLLLKVVTGQRPSSGDVRLLNQVLGVPASIPIARAQQDGLAYVASGRLTEGLEVPVAISTVELLTSGERQFIKRCPGSRCGWLFLDQSRNKTRRWCSMEICGNRKKARLHYARKAWRACKT